MKKRTKLLCIIISGCLLIGMTTACGNQSNSTDNVAKTSIAEEPLPDEARSTEFVNNVEQVPSNEKGILDYPQTVNLLHYTEQILENGISLIDSAYSTVIIGNYDNVISKYGHYIFAYNIPSNWEQDPLFDGQIENGIHVYSSLNTLLCGNDQIEIQVYETQPAGAIYTVDADGNKTESVELENYKKHFAEAQNHFYETGDWTAPQEILDPTQHGGPYYPKITKEAEIETLYGTGIVYTAIREYIDTTGTTTYHQSVEGVLMKTTDYFIDVQYLPYSGILASPKYTGTVEKLLAEMLSIQ